jgi:hypothetical protein
VGVDHQHVGELRREAQLDLRPAVEVQEHDLREL